MAAIKRIGTVMQTTLKTKLKTTRKTFNTVMLIATAALLQVNTATANTEVTTAAVAEQVQASCQCFSVQVYGQGPAVLLIPGVASSGSVWQSTVDALKDSYQLHVLTLAGFAGVAPLTSQQWSQGYLATQQQAILAYIAKNKLEKPIVIGHSLGGFLALSLAANHSEQIGGAVNVDGLPALGELFKQANAQSAEMPAEAFNPMAFAKTMTSNSQWQQQIIADMYRSDGMTSSRVMGELMQQDIRPQLSNIRVPVLTLGALLNGAPYSSPEQVQANYENQLKNAPDAYHKAAYAPDSRHFIMADAPDWLNQQLSLFLAKHYQG